MAYVANNPNDQNTDEETSSSNPYLTPESGQFDPASQSQNIQAGSPPVDKGGESFTDISKFLQANAPQEKRLAAKLGQGVVSQAHDANQQLSSAQNEYQNQLNDNTLSYDQDHINQIAQNPLGLFDYTAPEWPPPSNGSPNHPHGHHHGSGPGGTGAPTPYTPPGTPLPVSNQADYDYIQNIQNASYQGPQSIQGNEAFQGAQNQAVNAIQASDKTKDDVGRLEALRSLAGANYGSGAGALDNALLNTGAGSGVLDRDRAQTAGLNDKFGKAIDTASQATQNAQNSYGQGQQALQNAFFGEGGYYPHLQQQYADELAQAKTQYGNPNLTMQQIATPEDYARLQALNQLMGTGYTL